MVFTPWSCRHEVRQPRWGAGMAFPVAASFRVQGGLPPPPGKQLEEEPALSREWQLPSRDPELGPERSLFIKCLPAASCETHLLSSASRRLVNKIPSR